MKNIIYSTLIISSLLTGLVAVAPSSSASAKTKYYTNPQFLRRHKYWYSYQNAYTGKWRYIRLHFTKHTVYTATKTKRHAKWLSYHRPAARYYIKKSHGWYTYGSRESDDVEMIKPSWQRLNGHKHWTLGQFDPSNDAGGYGFAPYKVWDFTTQFNSQGWHHTISHHPS